MACAFISYRRDAAGCAWAERIDARLRAAGFDVWRDVDQIAPGDRWRRKIVAALESAGILLCVMTASADASDWVDEELHYARSLGLLIVPVQVEAPYRAPFGLAGVQHLDLHADDPQAWHSLLDVVRRHVGARSAATDPRDLERAYLDRLLYAPQRGVAQLAPIYTALAGRHQRVHSLAKAIPVDLMPMHYRYRAAGSPTLSALAADEATASFTDVLDVFRRGGRPPRLAMLGEPGAGKSFALRRLAAWYAQAATDDPSAPVPLLAELGKWTDELQSFRAFLGECIDPLGPALDSLLEARRVVLLLDALNEIPTAQQAFKVPQIGPWLHDQRLAGLVVTCREKDFTDQLQLDVDRLTIEPLDTPRIRTFVHRYCQAVLPEQADSHADRLLWRLAATDDPFHVQSARQAWGRARAEGTTFEDFWRPDRTDVGPHVRAIESERRSLLAIARNPYLLTILLGLDLNDRLPPHGERRAQVFALFVDDLLMRERENHRRINGGALPPGEHGLLEALGRVAWALQHAGPDRGSAQTSMYVPLVRRYLSPEQLRHAVAASLVDVRGNKLSFTHHLLQEYFAAVGLQQAIETTPDDLADGATAQVDAAGRARAPVFGLTASTLWPASRWWKRLGWEEVIHTLAALYAERPQRVIDWLGDANPEVLADALVANRMVESCRDLLTGTATAWAARMVDPAREPRPEARAAIGRALGRLGLDCRRGVGLTGDGLPDIEWCRVDAGDEQAHGPVGTSMAGFEIARFPVTNAQFAAFVTAGGYGDPRWWTHAAEPIDAPRASAWPEPNRPRESVSWFEAVAFCRWLGDATAQDVRLPTSGEWARAALGPHSGPYPWGAAYELGSANLDEMAADNDSGCAASLGETCAVGLYPHARSRFGVEDLIGNVWEWCADDADDGTPAGLGGLRPKRVCGGAWITPALLAGAALCSTDLPRLRSTFTGFRICRELSPSRR